MPGKSAPRSDSQVRWVAVLILGLAFALRVPQLEGPRFHPDEALFASFARSIAVWRDPLLAAAPVDKPPLLFYLQALCYPFLGPREMAARLPNLFASLATVALTYRVAVHFTGPGHSSVAGRSDSPPAVGRSRHHVAPLTAALLAALSPLAIALGPTAFTDPLMVMWCVAAWLAATRDRPAWAGLWLGLGLATKYQAALFLPLVAGTLWQARHGQAQRLWRLALGLMVPIAAVVIWDLARNGSLTLLETQVRSYGELRLATPAEAGARLTEWLDLGRYVSGSPGPSLLLLAALIGLLPWAWRQRDQGSTPAGRILSLWLLGYGLLHWAVTVNVWDRYLLPIVPVVSVYLAWLIEAALERLGPMGAGQLSTPDQVRQGGDHQSSRHALQLAARSLHLLIPLALLGLMAPAGLQAAGGRLALGGDHGTFDGIEQVAAYLSDHPYGTVLYDHWLSWELRYYLFDSRVYVSWFPDPAALATDLSVFGTQAGRYLLVPAWESAQPAIKAIEASGFEASPAFQARRPDDSVSFTLYRIKPADLVNCDQP